MNNIWKPSICKTSCGIVVMDEGKIEGNEPSKLHNPYKDDVVLVVEPAMLDTLSLGTGLGGYGYRSYARRWWQTVKHWRLSENWCLKIVKNEGKNELTRTDNLHDDPAIVRGHEVWDMISTVWKDRIERAGENWVGNKWKMGAQRHTQRVLVRTWLWEDVVQCREGISMTSGDFCSYLFRTVRQQRSVPV